MKPPKPDPLALRCICGHRLDAHHHADAPTRTGTRCLHCACKAFSIDKGTLNDAHLMVRIEGLEASVAVLAGLLLRARPHLVNQALHMGNCGMAASERQCFLLISSIDQELEP